MHRATDLAATVKELQAGGTTSLRAIAEGSTTGAFLQRGAVTGPRSKSCACWSALTALSRAQAPRVRHASPPFRAMAAAMGASRCRRARAGAGAGRALQCAKCGAFPPKSRGHCLQCELLGRVVSAALNVVFKLINSEFLFGNYILEQIADGNNADHFCVFDYGQMTHALVRHQGHT